MSDTMGVAEILSAEEKRRRLAEILRRRAGESRSYPVSFAQQRLWVVDRLEPDNSAYNMPAALRLRGAPDVPALRASLDTLVRRHGTLRTTFAESHGSPVQVIHRSAPVPLPLLDLRGLPAAAREEEARRLADADAMRPFDLKRGPLLRSTLLRLAEDDHVLLFTLHHVVSDGWSMQVLVREVSALYGAFSRGEEPRLAELPIQYADYAVWQREWLSGEVLEEQIGYWKERLAEAPPLLEIPTDHPRVAGQSARARIHRFALSAEVSRGLRALSRQEGTTLFMTLLAGWTELLGRWAGQEDVVVGTPIAGRTRRETEGLIGFFVNMLALRVDLSGDSTWTELLGRVREATLGAYDHQDLPFERLVDELSVERSLTHNPLFQTIFALDQAVGGDQRLHLGDLVLEPFGGGARFAKFELELTFAGAGEAVDGVILYRTALFEAETVARLAGHLEAVLEAMAAEPGRRLSQVSLLRGAERAQVLESWNATAADFPHACLHDLVSAQASRTPGAVAVVFEGQSLTYSELESRANRLAHHLRHLGIGPESRVGVCAERSPELVVALLGIFKAGGAYVPLDPAYPAERLAYMLEDSGVSVLLTQERLLERLPAHSARVLRLDRDAALWEGLASEPPAVRVEPESLAYVIYTSGSTGRPKGVAVEHRAVAAHLTGFARDLEITPADRVLHFASFGFDVSIEQLFLPLLNGGALVLRGPDSWAPEEWAPRLREARVTVANLPPVYWQEVIAATSGTSLPELRLLLVGAEAMPSTAVRRWREAVESPARLLNAYGPTEAVITATTFALPEVYANGHVGAIVPIGAPLAGRAAYVLDRRGEPAPVGLPGELYLGGAQLARGYLGRAELTAERFVPDAFSAEAGARLYRTGDRVKWREDGKLEYLGRIDQQVKVRGFRIEPGEVEAALLGHRGVRETVVTAREDGPGGRRLVAYVVPPAGVEVAAAELREYLRERLPEHMVPGAIVTLERLPLNGNGKVDRRALPAPERAVEGEDYVAPRTGMEEVLAGIWTEVLGIARVGAHDDFFALGGHSLLATQVVSRVRRALGIELPLRTLFEAPTLAALAGRIDVLRGAGTSQAPPIERVSRTEPPPLSFAQQRLWVVDRLEPGSSTYNMPSALRLRGAPDVDALRASLDALVARHETLRTVFAESDGRPVQVIHPPAPVPLPLLDLRGLPAGAKEEEARRLSGAEAMRPFDLERGPLLRSTLLRLAEDDHVLLFTLHHVVSDGWSTRVLVREVSALYAAFSRGEEPRLPGLPIQYADYAVWQRAWLSGEVLEEQIGYWKASLAGAPPLLEIPTDHPRVAGQSARARSHRFALSAEASRGLRALSRQEGTTLFMTLLAGWTELLGRWAGQEDVVVGSPIAGRTQQETEGLIGFFVNMLALRSDLSGDPTWKELLRRVREATLGAYEHQELPFERLIDELSVERSLTHTPVFQAIIALERKGEGDERLRLGDLSLEPFGGGAQSAEFDLELTFVDAEEALVGALLYRPALFEAGTIARLTGHLEAVLEAMAAGPGRRLSEVSLLRGAERAQVLEAGNATAADFPHTSLHDLVSARAARAPGAVAVVFEGQSLTYAELESRANQLAHHLRHLGVGPESRVGVCAERSPELVVALLGVLKAGGAYVPLDPAYPAERLAYMLEDSGVSVLLSQERLLERLPAHSAQLLCLDRDAALWEGRASEPPAVRVEPESLAYVIYTSGSTGRPKGVAVTHANVTRLFHATDAWFGFGEADVWTLFHSYAFDFSVWEIWGALLYGGRLVVVPWETSRSPEDFYALLVRERVTVLSQTPSAFRQLDRVEETRGVSPGLALRLVVFGGEALEPGSLRGWLDRHGEEQPRLVNMYGITETTVHVTYRPIGRADVEAGAGSLVGTAIPDLGVRVLDRRGHPVPVGVAGELYVGGAGVARGYLGRPELTAERFVPDAYGSGSGERLYRSGDRVRWLATGELEYLGRIDTQVKIRGFRIEPGEVESVLAGLPEVREAAVTVREDTPGEKRLVAYVVGRDGAELSTRDLRAQLSMQLPEHMVPGAVVVLERLPLNANGKVDRRALPAPVRGSTGEAYVAPRTEAEQILCTVLAGVLKLERVGVEENFFELGGDSILAIQVVSRARQRGLKLTPRRLFEHPTVARLAEVAEWVVPDMGDVAQSAVVGEAPLTPIQQRFLEGAYPNRSHFNQSLLLVPRERLEEAVLARVAAAMETHHDALRLRFRQAEDGTWTQAHAPAGEHRLLTVFDLSGVPAEARHGAIEATAGQVQRSLDIGSGPLLRMGYFALGADDPGRLLVAIHHLVVDGVSWRVLVEDLESAYTQLSRGEEPRLPAKTTSWQAWAERLAEHARSEALVEEAAYWAARAALEVQPLPVDDAGAQNTLAAARGVGVRLSEAETQALLREVPQAYRTQIDEVLLCALAGALARWTGERRVRIDLEGHGREEETVGGVDLSRTVGWFTSLYPVVLELPEGGGVGAALKAVKEQVRSVPGKGVGYGLLRYLARSGAGAELARAPEADVVFNYLGQLDQAVSAETFFGFASESAGRAMDPRSPRSHRLEVTGAVQGGRLELQIAYAEGAHRRETMERLVEGYAAELRAILAHCASEEAGGYTPSDFPLAGLEQAALDALLGSERGVEDVYPLTPLQEGVLFHTLYAPGSGMYMGQFGYVLEGPLDVAALERAWQGVVARHEAFRAGFAWEGLPRPVQVIRREAAPRFRVEDWRGLDEAERQARLERFLAEDLVEGFELGQAPLMRLALFRLGEQEHQLVWTQHHLILDGWSLSLVFRDVLEAYARGGALQLAQGRRFGEYVAWLERQDRTRAERFWREALAGFGVPTPLPAARPAGDAGGEPGDGMVRLRLSAERTGALQEQARRWGLTMSTVVQGAWAVLLGRYADEDDVVFGATVSGRPAELSGVEETVGMFINTLPVRVRLQGAAKVREWLAELQRGQVEAREYEYTPLVEVQRWSQVPEGGALFESLVVFENFPVDQVVAEAAGDVNGLRVRGNFVRDSGNYPLSLTAEATATLALSLRYDRTLFDAETAERLVGHLEVVFAAMASGPERRLSELSLLRESERAQVVTAWNATAAEFPRLCAHELFAEQAARTPDAPAVAFADRVLTYAELRRRANRLSHYLRRLGVGPEARVGMCMDRSAEMVVAIFGILGAGGVYLPLDPAYPPERLRHMLADSGAAVVLTRAGLAGCVEGHTGTLVLLDAEREAIQSEPDTAPESGVSPQNAAYIIYTSGSTGVPKGVVLPHLGLANVARAQARDLGVEAGDRVLQFASSSFDASVFETIMALGCGGTLYLGTRDELAPGPDLVGFLRGRGITAATLPPSALAVLPSAELPALRLLMTAGEALPAELVDRWAPGRALFNLYGPTEATIWSTAARCHEGAGRPSIGRPVGNTASYVLDASLEPAPVGVPGELYVGGVGVARGYLGRMELTAERFVPDALSGAQGARLYRTGDRARWLPTGELEFLGRADEQVKVRGYRIEPGEIEAVLRGQWAVREAVVLVREDVPGDLRLVGYVTAEDGAELSPVWLRSRLKERLPEYMVPSAIVLLERMPLTPNGKIDRRALPSPDAGGDAGPDAARTPVEEILSGIWAEVLNLESVGGEESFFELGGHSLLAIQAVSRIREVLGVEIPLPVLFEEPTVVKLAERVEALRSAGKGITAAPIERVPRDRPLPLSFAQQRLWLVDRIEPDSPAYNIPFALRLRGRLDLAALRASLDVLVRRHETLRTVFVQHDGAPVQVVHPPAPVPLPLLDLRGPAEGTRESMARRIAREEAMRPFDLARGPLLRGTLLRLGEEDHALLFTLHHIVSDAWSTDVLVREVSALYAGFSRGEEPALPELPVQYVDYAVWQRGRLSGEALEAQLGYWKERLTGAPPLLEIPTDRARATGTDPRAASHGFVLSAKTSQALRELSRWEGTTLFMTVLAGWQALLSKYSGQEEVVVGSPITGRTQRETEGLIGFFVNMLALRTDLAGDPTWAELLERVRETALGAYDHQDLPFERLVEELNVERSLTHTPVFQVTFGLDRSGSGEALSLGRLAIAPFAAEEGVAKFDLHLAFVETDEGLRGTVLYRAALFDAATVARMARHLEVVLDAMAVEPSRRISEVLLLRGAERTQVLEGWNATAVEYPRILLHDLVSAQAARTPRAVAVVFEGQSLTYAELEARANRLAHQLRHLGVGPESRVGVCAERSPELVVALLGVLKAGGAYVPLDPAYPAERLAYMLGDSGVPVLLTQERLLERLPEHSAQVLCLDRDAALWEGRASEPPAVQVEPESLAYVIYTSGSTGRPKGAMNAHRGIVNRLLWMQQEYGLDESDVVLQKTPFSFDVSVWEFFWPLLAGARLVLAKPEGHRDPAYLSELIEREGVSTLHFVPSMLQAFLDAGEPARCGTLRRVMCSGEALPYELTERFREALPGAELHNLYGPTEAAVDVTYWSCGPNAARRVPIGRPVANTRVYVLDGAGEPVPVGVSGELYIGGVQVGRGYLGRAELTAERFVPDAFSAEAGGVCTGRGTVRGGRATGRWSTWGGRTTR